MTEHPDTLPDGNASPSRQNRLVQGLVVFLLAIGLYANTWDHQFALDDSLVVTGNKFTQAGLDGLGDIWTTDAFIGAYGSTIGLPGGRYRPLTLTTLALEYEYFGPKSTDPEAQATEKRKRMRKVMHGNNILLYGLTALMLYLALLKLFPGRNEWLAFAATLLFVAHPLHTEVVANIKSRDEILGLLFLLIAIHEFCRKHWIGIVSGSTAFALGLLSKETPVTAIAVIPFALYFFRKLDLQGVMIRGGAMVAVTGIYLVLRSAYTEGFSEVEATNVMDSPYLYASGVEKSATMILVAGKYLLLNFWPHPLTFDYSYNTIPYTTFGDWRVIATILVYAAMLAWSGWNLLQAILGKARFSPIAFGILWYLAGFSIVSNVLFNIGAPMGERFMFMPGLGLYIALAAGLELVFKLNPASASKWVSVPTILIALMALVGSWRTIDRNPAWENNFELYSADVETVPNSARARLFMGITLLNKYYKSQDKTELNRAIAEMEAACEINPQFHQAWYNLGLGYQALPDHEKAIQAYETVLEISPMHINSHYYLGLSYGKGRNNIDLAIQYIEKGLQYGYNGADGYVNLGTSYGMKGDFPKALEAFLKAVPSNPNNAQLFLNIGTTYQMLQQPEQANAYYEKAFQLDPSLRPQLNREQSNR